MAREMVLAASDIAVEMVRAISDFAVKMAQATKAIKMGQAQITLVEDKEMTAQAIKMDFVMVMFIITREQDWFVRADITNLVHPTRVIIECYLYYTKAILVELEHLKQVDFKEIIEMVVLFVFTMIIVWNHFVFMQMSFT